MNNITQDHDQDLRETLLSVFETLRQDVLSKANPRDLTDLAVFSVLVPEPVSDEQRALGKLTIECLRMGNEMHPFMNCDKGVVVYLDGEFCGCFLYDSTFVLGGYYRPDGKLSFPTEKVDITDKLVQVCNDLGSYIVVERFDFSIEECV